MRIDLHTHSDRSDGTDTPTELVRRAAAVGLDVLGLTDHDTFAGWEDAGAEAERVGIRLIPGVELSCRYAEASVHLLVFGPDPTSSALLGELARITDGRRARIPAMIEGLRAAGVELTIEDATRQVGPDGTPGRPHVAEALVAAGHAPDVPTAFDRWLSMGKPGYVTRYAPDPFTGVTLALAAGGAPVLAHPRGRAGGEQMSDQVIAELASAGLVGLEVDHADHDPKTRAALRSLAADLGLVVTGASDYHGTRKVDHELGSETTDPEHLERLLAVVEAHPRGHRPIA